MIENIISELLIQIIKTLPFLIGLKFIFDAIRTFLFRKD